MAGMSKQGALSRWEQADPHKVTWAELWKVEPFRIKFLVQSVYDVLPSPAHLHTWGLVDTPLEQLLKSARGGAVLTRC